MRPAKRVRQSLQSARGASLDDYRRSKEGEDNSSPVGTPPRRACFAQQQQLSYGFDGSDGLVAETAFQVDGLIKNGLRTPQRSEAVPIKSSRETMNAVSATNPSIPSDP